MDGAEPDSSRKQLALGTVSFAICFCAWGLIGAFAPSRQFSLTATQTSFLVAAPVILGSLARIPVGLLTDRIGGRLTFTLLFVLSAAAALLVPLAGSYPLLIGAGFLLGVAGSSFAAGVGFVSKWFPPQAQGTALGVYGMGNAGQSAAVFLARWWLDWLGGRVFHGVAGLLLVWAVVFWALARNAPVGARANLRRHDAGPGAGTPAWWLSLFYFLTFGGFVAFLDLPADIAQGRLRTEPQRCRLPNRGLRDSGNPHTSHWRYAGGPHRRIARPGRRVPRDRAVCVPHGLDIDPAVHGRRAGMRNVARPGQWRCFQAGPAVLSGADRSRDGTGRRHGRPRRILSAAAAWSLSATASERSGRVSCFWLSPAADYGC